jgi:hypothetical protein
MLGEVADKSPAIRVAADHDRPLEEDSPGTKPAHRRVRQDAYERCPRAEAQGIGHRSALGVAAIDEPADHRRHGDRGEYRSDQPGKVVEDGQRAPETIEARGRPPDHRGDEYKSVHRVGRQSDQCRKPDECQHVSTGQQSTQCARRSPAAPSSDAAGNSGR